MELNGQVALVTGGSRGIGRAIALALAEAGASVAVNYLTSEERAKEVVRAIEVLGRPAILCQGDVSEYSAVLAMRERVTAELGPVAILVNNAGVAKMTPAMWRQVLAVNLDGVFNCIKTFVDDMVHAGYGRIVNITSVIGQIGNFGQANYAASKSGAMALTKTLAKELAAKGITVNAVAPGFIETDMVAAMPPAVRERILSQIPLRQFGRPEEVARRPLPRFARRGLRYRARDQHQRGALRLTREDEHPRGSRRRASQGLRGHPPQRRGKGGDRGPGIPQRDAAARVGLT